MFEVIEINVDILQNERLYMDESFQAVCLESHKTRSARQRSFLSKAIFKRVKWFHPVKLDLEIIQFINTREILKFV